MDLYDKTTWLELLVLPAIVRAKILQYCLDKNCFNYKKEEFKTLFLGQNEISLLETSVKEELRLFEESGGSFLFYFEEEYPKQLKEIQNPPPILLVFGDASLLIKSSIAVVGTHKMRHYGRAATKFLTEGLCDENIPIVTGILNGVEETVAKKVLERGGKLICVLAGGQNKPYPANNESLLEKVKASYGVVISEYLPNQRVEKGFFEERSRLISGLAKGVLIPEAEERSGALVTASYAVEFNRDVFAVPGNIFALGSNGGNSLISEGAKLVYLPQHIIEEIQ